jgi:SAM-dependent methyltransferase
VPLNCGALRTLGEQNMAMAVPFLPHRFRAAAPHYLAGRTPYPPRLIECVAMLTGLACPDLARTGRVLDLGCGPGQLALAFAPFAAEVLAVDPEPEMLHLARAAAGDAAIRFLQASSYDLGPAFGRFHLAVLGRSFHWMDRAETLRRLDAMIEPGGAVALFGDAHPEVPDNSWRAPWREVLDRYRAGPSGRSRYGTDWVRHEAFLLDSAFCRLDYVAAIDRSRIPVVTLVERALSRSTHSPERLGDRVEALSEDMLRALDPFVVNGMITEVVESYAYIATRPEAA